MATLKVMFLGRLDFATTSGCPCASRCAQHVVGLGTDVAGPICSKEFEAPRGLLNKCDNDTAIDADAVCPTSRPPTSTPTRSSQGDDQGSHPATQMVTTSRDDITPGKRTNSPSSELHANCHLPVNPTPTRTILSNNSQTEEAQKKRNTSPASGNFERSGA